LISPELTTEFAPLVILLKLTACPPAAEMMLPVFVSTTELTEVLPVPAATVSLLLVEIVPLLLMTRNAPVPLDWTARPLAVPVVCIVPLLVNVVGDVDVPPERVALAELLLVETVTPELTVQDAPVIVRLLLVFAVTLGGQA
jgi:hypothetical protein